VTSSKFRVPSSAQGRRSAVGLRRSVSPDRPFTFGGAKVVDRTNHLSDARNFQLLEIQLSDNRDNDFKPVLTDGIALLPDLPGIYCILNRLTGRRYVGRATKSIYKRALGHRSDFLNGTSANFALRREAAMYGAGSFFFFAIRHDAIEVKGRFETHLNKLELWFAEQLHAHDEQYGYNFEAGGKRTRASRFRDRERKLMRGNSMKYFFLPDVDMYDPINPQLLASWVSGS
jgi:hypothetical protein